MTFLRSFRLREFFLTLAFLAVVLGGGGGIAAFGTAVGILPEGTWPFTAFGTAAGDITCPSRHSGRAGVMLTRRGPFVLLGLMAPKAPGISESISMASGSPTLWAELFVFTGCASESSSEASLIAEGGGTSPLVATRDCFLPRIPFFGRRAELLLAFDGDDGLSVGKKNVCSLNVFAHSSLENLTGPGGGGGGFVALNAGTPFEVGGIGGGGGNLMPTGVVMSIGLC